MKDTHIFNIETDSEKLAMDIVAFLQKWGMWQDVQIFTGGKCYSDEHGILVISDDDSKSERLLDMTFEGPLSLLLRHHEYEVRIADVSDEVRHIIVPETEECRDETAELLEEFLEGKHSWDPAEFDSYEEWLELNQYCDLDINDKENDSDGEETEFSSSEEYEDFLMRHAVERELVIRDYVVDDIDDDPDLTGSETFFDDGRIAGMVHVEFIDLLEKYGLWYELCNSWSLTTYRKA